MELLFGLMLVAGALGAIGWAIYRLATMPDGKRVDALDATVRELRQRIEQLERRPGAPSAGEAASAQPPVTPPPVTHASVTLPPVTQPSVTQPSVTPIAPALVLPRIAKTEPPRRAVSLESFLGGRVMLVAGVIVGLFGVAFFLKFAIDHGWIGPAARVAMGALAGVALLVGGDRLRRRNYDVFGQALMGCGLGALYLSNYFAGTKYGFLSQGGAFLVAAAITAAGAALAVLRRAQALAWLGFLGGFLAPALLATPSGALAGLTVWLLVVDAGVLVVLLLRAWKGLELMALVATALYFGAWLGRYGTKADPLGPAGFLAALVAAALVLCLAPPIVRREVPRAASLAGAAGAGVLGVLAAHALLFPAWRRELGAAVLLLGALYVFASRLVTSRAAVADAAAARSAAASLLGFAVAALAAAIAVSASGSAVAPSLSAAGVAVVFAGTRLRQPILLAGGVGLVGLAFGDLLLNRISMFGVVTTPFLNERFAVFACPCVAMLACSWLMSRVGGLAGTLPTLAVAAGLWALPVIAGADILSGAASRGDIGFERRLAATTAALAVYGAVVAGLFAAGRDGARRGFAFGPIVLALLCGIWLLSDGHLTQFTPGGNWSFAAGLVLVAASLFAASTAVAGASARAGAGASANSSVGPVVGALPLLYLFALLTAEIQAWGRLRPLGSFTRREAEFEALVWLSIVWAAYAAALVGLGFWKRRAAVRWIGLAVFALTVGKVFLVDLARLQPIYRIGSFLVLGALLIGASFLYQRARRNDATTT